MQIKLGNMIKQYRPLEPGEFFTVGVDTSYGGLDYCCAQFLAYDKLDVPLVIHTKMMITELTPLIHDVLEVVYDKTGIRPIIAYERNNGGAFELERLASMNRNGKYGIFEHRPSGMVNNGKPRMIGWNTSSATRPKMLGDLKDAIDHQQIRIYDWNTIEELNYFVKVQTSTAWKAEAEQGSHDDMIFALAIAYQLYQTEKKPSPTATAQTAYHNMNLKRSGRWSIK